MGKRQRGVREGGSGVESGEGVYKNRGSGVGRLSSVPRRVGGGMTNREMGGGLITKGRGGGGRVGGGGTRRQLEKEGTLARWTLVEPGWLGTASGVRAANMAGVNSEGRDFINWHGSP
jgi:hypothetical protein